MTHKRDGHEFFDTYGWQVLDQDLLPEVAMRYIAGDSDCLFGLEAKYASKMEEIGRSLGMTKEELMKMVDEESLKRVRESEREEYDPHADGKAEALSTFLDWIRSIRGAPSLTFGLDRSGERNGRRCSCNFSGILNSEDMINPEDAGPELELEISRERLREYLSAFW